MDAIVLNGANSGMINFAEPGSGFNFSNPPDFSAQAYIVPDQWGDNPHQTAYLSPYGIVGEDIFGADAVPDNVPIQTLTGGLTSFWYVDANGSPRAAMSLKPLLYLQWEIEAAADLFGWLELPPFPLIDPTVGDTRSTYQTKLDQLYTLALQNEIRNVYLSTVQRANSPGVSFTGETWWDATPFIFDDNGEFVGINPLFGLPWNIPFSVYSAGDSSRLMRLCNNVYNFLSYAYGTGQTINLFPPRDSFWDKLWDGVKKYFPLMVAARTAFRGLVATNVFQLADKMAEYDDPNELKKSWENFGGKWSELVDSINDGTSLNTDHLGEPASALIAAAAPIVAAFLSMLKKQFDIEETIKQVFQSAVSQECQQYLASWSNFIAEFQLQNLSADQLSQQFAIDFPGVPQDCFDFSEVVDKFTDVLPGGGTPEPSGSGPNPPPDPNTAPPNGTEEIEDPGDSTKNLLILGTVIFALKSLF